MSTLLATRNEKLMGLRLEFILQLPKMVEQVTTNCDGAIEGHADPEAQVRR